MPTPHNETSLGRTKGGVSRFRAATGGSVAKLRRDGWVVVIEEK